MAEHPETTATENRAGNKPREAYESTAQEVRKLAAKAAQAAESGSGIALDASRRAAEEAGENAALGMKAMRDMQASFAEATLERTQRMMDIAAEVAAVYRDASQRTADDVQALMSSFHSIGGGVQQWQRAYLDWMAQSFERLTQKGQELARATSPLQLAEVQRDMLLGTLEGVVTANSHLLQLAAQTAQESVRTLQDRARAYAHA